MSEYPSSNEAGHALIIQLGDDTVSWNGTEEEFTAVLAEVDARATCPGGQDCYTDDEYSIWPDCPAHSLLNHQRTLDGLLLALRSARRGGVLEWWPSVA